MPTDKELREIAAVRDTTGDLAREVLRLRRALRQVDAMLGHGEELCIGASEWKGKRFLIDYGSREICGVIVRALRPARAKKARKHA